MNLDLQIIAMWASAFIAIISFAKLIVQPFMSAIKKNEIAMQNLNKTIDALSRDLQDSQKDRENIHKILDKHDCRISKTEDEIISHRERIDTLFRR